MVEEVKYVDQCPNDDCDASFMGMTPDDVRAHLEDDHGDPLGWVAVFPTDDACHHHGRETDD